MKWQSFASADDLAAHAAALFLQTIRENPHSVLGLPTGRTPVGMYRRVVAECSRVYRCFTGVTTFNLDEYVGIARDHPGSYFTYMREHLFRYVDIDLGRTHFPDGPQYDGEIEAAGGLDLTFLGLGSNGHIAFNEPGTPFSSRTHVVQLAESTRRANAEFFPEGNVPTHAITMGIATILGSRRIVLLAAGPSKKEAIEKLRGGAVDVSFPASALHHHADVTVLTA